MRVVNQFGDSLCESILIILSYDKSVIFVLNNITCSYLKLKVTMMVVRMS